MDTHLQDRTSSTEAYLATTPATPVARGSGQLTQERSPGALHYEARLPYLLASRGCHPCPSNVPLLNVSGTNTSTLHYPAMMVDLSKLSAPEFASQLARPSGDIGLAVGDYMNRINCRLIGMIHRRLVPPPHGRVLEIGFGNGELIADLLAMAPGLCYAGVEISDTMLAAAREHNHTLLHQGRVELHLASVERLPFADASFDRVLAVNTLYFWPDQLAGLGELRRVLRADGWLVVASMTPDTSAKSPTARAEYGFSVPDRDKLMSLHGQAGFRRVDCELYEEENTRLDGTAFHRAYHIVLARP